MVTYAELHCDKETNRLISELIKHCESLNVSACDSLPEIEALSLNITKTVKAIESELS